MRPARLIVASRPAVVLVAHGSRDPRAGRATEALARAVRRAHPEWDVHATYLDHAGPRPLTVLAALGSRRAVLTPLLLTAAYHGRVDVPAIIADAAELAVQIVPAEVLGPVPTTPGVPALLLDALVGRLPADGYDAVVLAAAGTRDPAARRTVERAAAALSARLGLPCVAAYASGSPPSAGEAVARLRAGGARRVAVASYFLAPGLLHDVAVRSAREAGVVAVSEPLGDAAGIVRLVGLRVAGALGSVRAAA